MMVMDRELRLAQRRRLCDPRSPGALLEYDRREARLLIPPRPRGLLVTGFCERLGRARILDGKAFSDERLRSARLRLLTEDGERPCPELSFVRRQTPIPMGTQIEVNDARRLAEHLPCLLTPIAGLRLSVEDAIPFQAAPWLTKALRRRKNRPGARSFPIQLPDGFGLLEYRRAGWLRPWSWRLLRVSRGHPEALAGPIKTSWGRVLGEIA